MIADCFLYHGTDTDQQLLEVRLRELRDVVDLFVLVEAGHTHSGQRKGFAFRERAFFDDAIAPYRDKIVAIALPSLPANATPLTRENIQRAAIQQGIQHLSPEDWVLVSDLDEIPRVEAVHTVAEQANPGVHLFAQRLSYYYLNCLANQQPWFGTRMVRRADFTTPQTLRHVNGHIVHGGGWHMSYLGGVSEIQTKISAYLHQEYNLPEITAADHIAQCLAEGRDLFGRADQTYTVQPVDANDHTLIAQLDLPTAIREHPARYAHWFAPQLQSTPDEHQMMPVEAPTTPSVPNGSRLASKDAPVARGRGRGVRGATR